MAEYGNRRIILWRHGETDANHRSVFQGHLDTSLNSRGLDQARAAAPALAALQPDQVWSSDLQRAATTAQELVALTGQQVRVDTRLREIDVGQWQGLSRDEVAQRWPEQFAALTSVADVRRGETGESMAMLAERLEGVAEEILHGLGPAQTALISGHGMSSRVLAASLLGLEQDLAWRLLGGLGNAYWAVLAEQSTGWRLLQWNVGVLPSTSSISDR